MREPWNAHTRSCQTAQGEPKRVRQHFGIVQLFPPLPCGRCLGGGVSGRALVGRGASADIRLEGNSLAEIHAVAESARDGLRIRSVGSEFGLSVDGAPVGQTPQLASVGSIVRLGDVLCLVTESVEPYLAGSRAISGAALGLEGTFRGGPTLSHLWDRAKQLATFAKSILIQGETGTGKEVVARLIHRSHGARPFVALNAAAIPDSLFESELFGHERGAFTGARTSRLGAFREASGGVLFLDEIGDLSLHLQVKLLRAIELQSVRPIGADRDVPVALSIVAATSRDLWRACEQGAFRKDLFYRLAGARLEIPPLRARREDILPLAYGSIEQQSPGVAISADAAHQLLQGRWEGNVRQLRFAMTHALCAAAMAGRPQIEVQDLPALAPMGRGELEHSVTRDQLLEAFRAAGGVASHAARLLRVSRTTLYAACRRCGLDPAELRSLGKRVHNGRQRASRKSPREARRDPFESVC